MLCKQLILLGGIQGIALGLAACLCRLVPGIVEQRGLPAAVGRIGQHEPALAEPVAVVLHQAGAIAKSVGALFLRSYERGERVYLAMLSRGYDGTVPPLVLGPGGTVRAPVREWTVAMLPSIAAVAVATSAWVLR